MARFSDVDADPDSATLVAALDEQAAMPAVQRLRAAATELLNLRPGDRVVDVGCGTGDTTRALARIVGPEGAVIGIDPSNTMLAEARRRTAGQSRPVSSSPGTSPALTSATSRSGGLLARPAHDAAQRGRFFWAVTMFAVAATG